MIELAPTLRVFQKVGDNSITYFSCANDGESLSCNSNFIVIILPDMQARGPPRAHKNLSAYEKQPRSDGAKKIIALAMIPQA